MRTSGRLVVATLSLIMVGLPTQTGTLAQATTESGPTATTYTNPLPSDKPHDYPDPAVIRAKDGLWYAVSTGPGFWIAKSADLISWQQVGTVFPTPPPWAGSDAMWWAPDIRYINGTYVLYYSVVSSNTWRTRIGVATAPTPAGPWTDSGGPLVVENPGTGMTTVMDPSGFTDNDGTNYVYFGSYPGGNWAVRLDATGTRVDPTMAPKYVVSKRYEGVYLVQRAGWYYMFASTGSCCSGPASGYGTFVGRSRAALGPFLDRNGDSMAASRAGGTIVQAMNGNEVLGPGHGSVVTDLAGQTWWHYHAHAKSTAADTWRRMHIDRLDWIDGWPIVRGGAGGSDSPQTAPVTDSAAMRDSFEDDTATVAKFSAVNTTLKLGGTDPDSRGNLALTPTGSGPALALTHLLGTDRQRLEADLRLPATGGGTAAGLVWSRDSANRVEITVDRTGRVTVNLTTRGKARVASRVLPRSFVPSTWHNLSAEFRGNTVHVEVTSARQGDPTASFDLTVPSWVTTARPGLISKGGAAEFDNFSAAVAYQPQAAVTPPPTVPTMALANLSDEFAGPLRDIWHWLRTQDPAAQVVNGALTWPTGTGNLMDATGSALLVPAPAGPYMLETKLSLDVGTDTVRDFQQAGLAVYVHDGNLIKLVHQASSTLRIIEFQRKATSGQLWAGAANLGRPADTVWLRINVTVAPGTGEQRYQAGVSLDGTSWIWGAVWTMPAGTQPKVGLISQGSQPGAQPATAKFEYFRVYKNRGTTK